MNVKSLTPLFSAKDIAERVNLLAAEIDHVYGDTPLLIVCVLKGAAIFFADIVRALRKPHITLDFVRVSSYGMANTPEACVSFLKDVEVPLEGKDVLVIEDIIDTGQSMDFLMGQFAARSPRSLRLAVLVDKTERRHAAVRADFVGFALRQGFIVGYGLDYAEQYRQLPDICTLDFA